MAAGRHFLTRHGRRLVVWLPLVWLVVFFALPLVEVVQSGAPLGVYMEPISPAAMDLMSDPGANRQALSQGVRMVRPEHLTASAGAADDAAFAARLLSRETNGSETYLHCDVDGAHWVARLDGLIEVPVGEPLTLYAPVEAVREFVGGGGVG